MPFPVYIPSLAELLRKAMEWFDPKKQRGGAEVGKRLLRNSQLADLLERSTRGASEWRHLTARRRSKKSLSDVDFPGVDAINGKAKEALDMQYMMLIYCEEAVWTELTQEEQAAVHAEYASLRKELETKGKFLGGNALQSVQSATSVRLRGGKRTITDGPFAETKDQLGGYFMVDAADLDEALDVAARLPSARYGTIEVRPIFTIPTQRE